MLTSDFDFIIRSSSQQMKRNPSISRETDVFRLIWYTLIISVTQNFDLLLLTDSMDILKIISFYGLFSKFGKNTF